MKVTKTAQSSNHISNYSGSTQNISPPLL